VIVKIKEEQMKRFVLVFLLVAIIVIGVSAAEPVKGIGVGLEMGAPPHIGASADYNFGPAYAGLSLGYNSGFFWLRAEGGYNLPKPFVYEGLEADLYLSAGGAVDFLITKGWAMYGIGVPITWSYTLPKIPLKFYVKAGPELLFGKGMGVSLQMMGSVGAKYVFEI
jgi:hypothetical protein